MTETLSTKLPVEHVGTFGFIAADVSGTLAAGEELADPEDLEPLLDVVLMMRSLMGNMSLVFRIR